MKDKKIVYYWIMLLISSIVMIWFVYNTKIEIDLYILIVCSSVVLYGSMDYLLDYYFPNNKGDDK